MKQKPSAKESFAVELVSFSVGNTRAFQSMELESSAKVPFSVGKVSFAVRQVSRSEGNVSFANGHVYFTIRQVSLSVDHSIALRS